MRFNQNKKFEGGYHEDRHINPQTLSRRVGDGSFNRIAAASKSGLYVQRRKRLTEAPLLRRGLQNIIDLFLDGVKVALIL